MKVLRKRITSHQAMLVLALSITGASLLSGCRSPVPGLPGRGASAPGELHARLSGSGAESASGPLLVYLEPLDAEVAASATRAPATIRPKDGAFSPALVVVTVGQRVRFASDANLVHRVFSYAEGNVFERELAAGGAAQVLAFDRPGEVPYYCSLHPSERGTIFIAPSPWFAQADSRGEIHIPRVPAGRYRLHVWGEAAQAAPREIVVQPGQAAALNVAVRRRDTSS